MVPIIFILLPLESIRGQSMEVSTIRLDCEGFAELYFCLSLQVRQDHM